MRIKNIARNNLRLFFILVTFYSCSHKSDVEKLLISSKKNLKIWTTVDVGSSKIDTLNLTNALIFRDNNSLENFSVINGKKYYPISIEESHMSKRQWEYDKKTNNLKIGISTFQIISSDKDSLLLKTISRNSKQRTILLKKIVH